MGLVLPPARRPKPLRTSVEAAWFRPKGAGRDGDKERVTVPARLRLTLAACVAVGALAALPAQAGANACASASAAPGQVGHRTMVHATLCLLNAQRRAHGLRPLRLNRRLGRAARRHTRDMVRRRYFSHTSRSGASFVDRIRRTGYLRSAHSWVLGENIAWGAGSWASARAVMRAWMHSAGHRRNILTGRYRQVGIGIAFGSPNGMGRSATYTTDFGARR
jgi:uncharacterized protein YkwD